MNHGRMLQALALACASGLIACACHPGGGGTADAASRAHGPGGAASGSPDTVPGPSRTSSSAVPAPRVSQGQTVVSLTFDDAYEDQWLYGAPFVAAHHMTATYYVINSASDGPRRCCMSWFQLGILQSLGNDIGSHTISHPDLAALTPGQMRREICGSRQEMISHGIADPRSFAYPFGIYNRTMEDIVRQCGFSNARTGGGISVSDTTPSLLHMETIPPGDPYALKAIPVDGSQPMRLPDLEGFVVAAAAQGGGWLPINFHQVCDAGAADFSKCMSSYGPVQDTVLGQFLDWLAAAGRPGGAPAGVVVKNVCQVMSCP